MAKFIKAALIFMGGMTIGGYCTVNAALKSETFTSALKDALTKKMADVLYGSEHNQPNHAIPRNKQITMSCPGDISDIIFANREDADITLDKMTDVINAYGFVSLADVYDLIGHISPAYTYNKYGWTSVNDGKVVRRRNGYYIDLPKPVEIQ